MASSEGFEPSTTDLEGQCYIQAKPRAHPALDTHLVIKPLPSQGHKNETFLLTILQPNTRRLPLILQKTSSDSAKHAYY